MRVSGVAEVEQGDPPVVALENALRKARAVRRAEVPETIVGCDTVVALDGRLYGKPPDARAAAATIRALGGRTQQVISGLAVLLGEEQRTTVVRTEVTFRALDEQLVSWYVSTGEWRERSGGYAVQGQGSALVREVRGDVDNVVGLPLAALLELVPELREAG